MIEIKSADDIIELLGQETFANMSRCEHIFRRRIEFLDIFPIGSHLIQCSDCGYFWLFDEDVLNYDRNRKKK